MGGNAARVGTCTATEQFHSLSLVERETKAPAPRNLLSTRRSRSGETTSLSEANGAATKNPLNDIRYNGPIQSRLISGKATSKLEAVSPCTSIHNKASVYT